MLNSFAKVGNLVTFYCPYSIFKAKSKILHLKNFDMTHIYDN